MGFWRLLWGGKGLASTCSANHQVYLLHRSQGPPCRSFAISMVYNPNKNGSTPMSWTSTCPKPSHFRSRMRVCSCSTTRFTAAQTWASLALCAGLKPYSSLVLEFRIQCLLEFPCESNFSVVSDSPNATCSCKLHPSTSRRESIDIGFFGQTIPLLSPLCSCRGNLFDSFGL